jgi:hypothetical protein
MKRDRELDDAEPCADVSARARADVYETSAQLGREHVKVVASQPAKVSWRRDSI